MFVRAGIPVRAAWIAAGLLLAACAQAPDKVRINIGTGLIDDKPARDYAALYLPYAKMSSIAYTDAQFLTPHAGPNPDCPDPQRLAGSDPAGRNPNNRRWLAELNAEGWRCLFGLNNPRECPQGMSPCDPLRGLELHVWTRRCQAVIAFRGTDYDERGDWLSNLRWFLGPAHLFDEYRQVQFHMSAILRRIRGVCRSPHIVVTGHSLGGGLAQHAAYAAGGSVRYVYAFDPSPVIGYFDVPQGVRMKAREGLGIDYVYEVGEVLDAPRYILGGFANPQPCNPRMRIVRFNTIATGSGVVQHAMQSLTGKMQEVARGGNPAKAREENKTKNCTYV